MENNPSSSTSDRKFIERNRRNEMKALFSRLNSVVPHQSSREASSRTDQIHEATNYIKNLQIKLEKMNEKRNNLLDIEKSKNNASMNMGLHQSPQFKVQQMGSALEVVLVTGLDCQFMFNETIRVLQEEGSDVVNTSYTVVENAIFHTIHCQVEESANGALRITEKLNKFLYHSFQCLLRWDVFFFLSQSIEIEGFL